MSGIYRSAAGARALAEAYTHILGFWPVPHAQLRVPTRQGETFVVASGDPARPALVLLHGAASNSFAWMGDVAAWSEHFRVYAVDVIGEPGFSAPSRPATDGPAFAEWLDEVLAGLGVARASFVGMSMGGWIALDYAIRRPARVEKLALLGPGGLGRTRPGQVLRTLAFRLLGPLARRPMATVIDRFGLPQPIADYLKLIFTHFRPRTRGFRPFRDAALRTLRMPVLLVAGARDDLLDSAHSRERLTRLVPHAQVLWLPDAGHAIAGQAAPILEFLR